VAADSLDIVDLGRRGGLAGTEEVGGGADELRHVLVGRRQVGGPAGPLGGAGGQRAHDVVRLEAVHAQDRQAQRLGQLDRHGDRSGEVFGHLLPLRLVERVALMTEGRGGRVQHQRDMRRRLFVQDLQQHVGETGQRRGVDAGAGHARGFKEHEMSAVEQRHDIDQKEFLVLAHGKISGCTTADSPPCVCSQYSGAGGRLSSKTAINTAAVRCSL